jgi:ABC-2 type transport system ATP-binding protein
MRFNYKLSRSARRNLQEISDYWMTEAGEGVALRIATDILETIITLSSQPRAGAPAEQFGEGVRKFAAGKYIIYYRLRHPGQSRFCTCSTEREINGKRGWAKPNSDGLKPSPPGTFAPRHLSKSSMLELRALTKRYSGTMAVDDVSFTALPGEVTGYLGPNGSGKSTTVKMITGLLDPTAGEILYRGRPIRDHLVEFKRILGYVPEEPYLYPHLTGAEYLELAGELRDLPAATLPGKIGALLELFSLTGDRHAPISSYSKGMRQKILICAAILHDPEVIVLDEPFSGLDVHAGLVLRSLIRSLAASGKTVLFSSHVLEVVEKVCHRVVILHKGRVVANDSIERLRDLMALPTLEDIFAQLVTQSDPDATARQIAEVVRQ